MKIIDDNYKRDSFWESFIMFKWENDSTNITKMIANEIFCYGIPQQFRALIWYILCQHHSKSNKLKTKPLLTDNDSYTTSLLKENSQEIEIQKDISRTFPLNSFFDNSDGIGQTSIYNLLKAISNYDSTLGYCQGTVILLYIIGMGFLAGYLTLYCCDEISFKIILNILYTFNGLGYYSPGLPRLQLALNELTRILKIETPPYISFYTVD